MSLGLEVTTFSTLSSFLLRVLGSKYSIKFAEKLEIIFTDWRRKGDSVPLFLKINQ